MEKQLTIKSIVSIPNNVKPVLGDHDFDVLCKFIDTLLVNGVKLELTYSDIPRH